MFLAPATILSGPGQITAEVGIAVQFNCKADKTEQTTWSWQFDENDITGDGVNIIPVQNSLLITEVGLSNAGEYKCEVRNPVGEDQKTGSLTVFGKLIIIEGIVSYFVVKGKTLL